MNPLYYTMFIEGGLDETSAFVMGCIVIAMVGVGVVCWLVDLFRKK